jgi:hypothetical protein
MTLDTKWISDNYKDNHINDGIYVNLSDAPMPESLLSNPRILRHLYKIRKHLESSKKRPEDYRQFRR